MLPIVLHHGLFGYDHVKFGSWKMAYFRKIDEAITGRGFQLCVTKVHPTASVRERAEQLKKCIEEKVKGEFILIAHSMGGLDARYLISKMGMASRVRALVTVTTPHRGSPYADWLMRNLEKRTGLISMIREYGFNFSAGFDLTTEGCKRFNENVLDAPGVKYFSVRCGKPGAMMPFVARHSHRVIEQIEGENDGLVSKKSSPWGTVIEDWEIDHWQAINRQFSFRFQSGDVSARYLGVIDRVVKDL